MTEYGKWNVIEELGSGGQGKVYLALDSEKLDIEGSIVPTISKAIINMGKVGAREGEREEYSKQLAEAIANYQRLRDPYCCGALKVLYRPQESDSSGKALERMQLEITALQEAQHPNILRILDKDIKQGWFVGEYFPCGPLSKYRHGFRGDIVKTLRSMRGVVQGVSLLHSKGQIHRDIKPDNIFVSHDQRLVLGDLGLVFFSDSKHTRISDTYENVGSRDWMPPWGMGMRIEDIRPTFDVFCLGKTIWSLLSGKTILLLWYHHKDEFELENMFPSDPGIRWARRLLDKCITEEESDCLPDASKLLELMDEVLQAVERHCQVINENARRVCMVCGLGEYVGLPDDSITTVRNFGLNPTGASTFKIFICFNCGHVQLFHMPNNKNKRPSWKE